MPNTHTVVEVGSAGNLALHFHAVNQHSVSLFEVFFDETGHEDVAFHINVLANVQARYRGADPEFDRLYGLSR